MQFVSALSISTMGAMPRIIEIKCKDTIVKLLVHILRLEKIDPPIFKVHSFLKALTKGVFVESTHGGFGG